MTKIPTHFKNRRALALEGHVTDAQYYFFDTPPQSKTPLAIVFGGHEKCAPDFEIKRNTYPYYVIEFPLSGCCRLSVENREYELKKGMIGGFMPGMRHHYHSTSGNPMEHIFIVFTGIRARDLFRMTGLDTQNVMALPKPGEMLYLAETILKKGLEKSEWTQQLCIHYLQALLLELADRPGESTQTATLSHKTYQKCRKYIDNHFSLLIGPGEVADACDVNVRYMARLFKQFAKITPYEYLMLLKLNKAAGLLLMSNLTIAEVAGHVGFEDPYHFSRNFKKFHGRSPRHYRDTHLEKNSHA